MSAFAYSAAAAAPSGPTTTTFDLSTGTGLTLLDSTSGLADGSFGASGLDMTTSTVATALYGAPNAAPIYQARLSRDEFVGARAIARVHEIVAGGTFPEVFLCVALDSATLGTSHSHAGIRTATTPTIRYSGNSYTAGPAITAQQRSDGMWLRADIGGAGGIVWSYSLENTSDVSAVTWTAWPSASWEVTGWVAGANNTPGDIIRVGVGVSDAGTGATQITGRCSYFAITTSGTLS